MMHVASVYTPILLMHCTLCFNKVAKTRRDVGREVESANARIAQLEKANEKMQLEIKEIRVQLEYQKTRSMLQVFF